MDRQEIRPARGANSLKMIGLMALLVPASAWMMVDAGSIILKAVGALGVVFFGGGGVFALASMIRTPWTLALAPEALEIRIEDHIARIPWADIEAVGLANVSGQKMPSIRLVRYDNYLASFSPEAAQAFEGRWTVMKWITRTTMVLGLAPGLAGHAGARSLADALRANRDLTGGFDIGFAWSQIDRPPEKFTAFLEEEWRRRR